MRFDAIALLSYLQYFVFTYKSVSIVAYEANIERVIDDTPTEICQKVAQNLNIRLDHLKRSRVKWQQLIYWIKYKFHANVKFFCVFSKTKR